MDNVAGTYFRNFVWVNFLMGGAKMIEEDEKYTWMDIGTSGGWRIARMVGVKFGRWRIGYGVSNFLIVEGSGWSRQFGLYLYNHLRKGIIKWPL